MAEERLFRDVQVTSDAIQIRKIGISDLWRSLKEGYDDFNAKPTYLFFLLITYPMFALFLIDVCQVLIGVGKAGMSITECL